MLLALTRDVSRSLERCELTHLERTPVDVGRAEEQHRAYERCLSELGCRIRRIPPAPDLPDAVFVEDAAVVLDELAVVARLGAASRRAETEAVRAVLGEFRPLTAIEPPGTLDGGDVLRVGRTVWVGRSSRTNASGARQLERLLAPRGYAVRFVEVRGCLHLKTAVTQVAESTLLINPRYVPPSAFEGLDLIEVDPSEPMAANAILLGGTVVHPADFPRTRRRLEDHGVRVRPVELSELAKAEGGVTCCSIVLEA